MVPTPDRGSSWMLLTFSNIPYLLSHDYSEQAGFGLALIFANSIPTFLCEPT